MAPSSEKKRKHDEDLDEAKSKAERKAEKAEKKAKKAAKKAALANGDEKPVVEETKPSKKSKKDRKSDVVMNDVDEDVDMAENVAAASSHSLGFLFKQARYELLKTATEKGSGGEGTPEALKEVMRLVQSSGFDEKDTYTPKHYVIKKWNPVKLHQNGYLRFASPFASDAQMIKVLRLVNMGMSGFVSFSHYSNFLSAAKSFSLARGIKEVEKSLNRLPKVSGPKDVDRNNPPALLVMGADVWGEEILMHMQAYAEEYNVPSIFVFSRHLLGRMSLTKTATSVVLVLKERRPAPANKPDKYKEKPVVSGFDERYASVAQMMVRLDSQLHYKQAGFVSQWPSKKEMAEGGSTALPGDPAFDEAQGNAITNELAHFAAEESEDDAEGGTEH
jgi:ribosomal protein L7Ae-like RNA K-turn-binding protein